MKELELFLEQAQELIKKNKINDVIELISEFTKGKEDYSNDLIQISSQYNRLEKDKISGIVKGIEINIGLNQITDSLLKILKEIENSLSFLDNIILYEAENEENVKHAYLKLSEYKVKTHIVKFKDFSHKFINNSNNVLIVHGTHTDSINRIIPNLINSKSINIINIIFKAHKPSTIPLELINFPKIRIKNSLHKESYLELIKLIRNQNTPLYFESDPNPLENNLPKGFEANVPQIVNILIGESLYKRRDVSIRELIQNSYDACVRRRIKSRNSFSFSIVVNINSDDHYIEFKDNGDGMNSLTLRKSFSIIGKSINREFESSIYEKALLHESVQKDIGKGPGKEARGPF